MPNWLLSFWMLLAGHAPGTASLPELLAQDYSSGSPQVMQSPPVVAGGTWTVIYGVHTFDFDSSPGDCTDTGETDGIGVIDASTGGDCNCDAGEMGGNCPLNGADSHGGASAETAQAITEFADQNGCFIIDWLTANDFTGGGGANIMRTLDAASTEGVQLTITGSSGSKAANLNCGGGASDAGAWDEGTDWTQDTVYNVRISYCVGTGNPLGCSVSSCADCGCLLVDTGATWGSTEYDTCDDASAVADLDGLQWGTSANNDWIWDDISVCTYTGSPTGRCQ